MIGELIFSLVMGALTGFVLYRFAVIREKRKIMKNLPKKLEAQKDKIIPVGDNLVKINTQGLQAKLEARKDQEERKENKETKDKENKKLEEAEKGLEETKKELKELEEKGKNE